MKKREKYLTTKNKLLLAGVLVVTAAIAVAAAFLTWHKLSEKLGNDAMSGEVVAVVDGQELTMGQFIPYLKMSYASLGEYLGTDVSLDRDMGDGSTVASYICYDAMESIRTYRLIEEKAAELSIGLTADQEETLAAALEYWDGQAGGGDSDTYAYITRCDMLYTNLYNAYYGPQGSLLPSDEEVLQWCQKNGIIRAEYILLFDHDAQGTPYDEAGMAEQRHLGENILNLYAAGTPFEDLVAQYSYDGGQEDTYMSTSDCSQEFLNAYYALADGQLSDVVTFDSGYFIIHRLPIDPVYIRTSGNMTGTLFSYMVSQWFYEQEHTTTEVYHNLDATALETLLELDAD